MTNAYQALVTVFSEDRDDPPTAEAAARLTLKMLNQQGFAVVPITPPREVQAVLRQAIHVDKVGWAKAWTAAVERARH